MRLVIDSPQRYAKMRAHTATHLLHTALTKYFPNTKQAGSLVDSDFLRFDFYTDALLSYEQLKEIETWINDWIYEALPVSLTEISFDEATKLGAKAFFEEKYWDSVRLIRIHRDEDCISAELCWGTHVSNTREIWAFTIISQEAVASGIKRIIAYTWPKVIEKLHTDQDILNSQIQILDVKSSTQIWDKITKLLKELELLKSHSESLENKVLSQLLDSIKKRKNANFDTILELPEWTNFKPLPSLLRQYFPDTNTILAYTTDWTYLILTDWSISAKSITQKFQLKGGWSDTSAQGKDTKITSII